MKNFVKGTLKAYDVSANQSRISLVTFGSKPRSSISFKEGIHRSVAEQALFEMTRVGGISNLKDVLTFIAERVFTKDQDRGKLLVLMVNNRDFQFEGDSDVKKALTGLEKRNVRLLVVAIGKEIDDDLKSAIDPNKITGIADAKDLRNVYSKVLDESAKAAGMNNFLTTLKFEQALGNWCLKHASNATS